MGAGSIFVSCVIILLIFNFFYVLGEPSRIWTMTIGALVGLAASAVAVGVISGISILGSGLNTASVKIIFGMATLLNILFKIDLGMGAEKGGSFQIGLGLASNIVSVFSPTELWGIGWILATAIGIVAFVCGMLTLSGGATL